MENQTSNSIPAMENQNKKLKRGNSDVDNSDDCEEIINTPISVNWPKFLLIQSVDPDHPITKLSPFTIHQGIQGLAGTPWTIHRFHSDDLLIEVTRRSHVDGLLRSTVLADIPIKMVPHRSLNTSKGIIYSFDLRDCCEAEIKVDLVDQGVQMSEG